MAATTPVPSFGALLRDGRLARGLTQEALAERAGVSPRAVQALERGETRPQRETAARLAAALELRGDQLTAFHVAAQPTPRQHATAGRLAAGDIPDGGDRRHNLPAALTSFIGRERELAALASVLPTARLLTLTGTGGCGKTRLALQAAAAALPAFADGVWFVDLASLTEPALMTEAIAHALDVREQARVPLQASLIAFLDGRRLLLVLDNCEHLLAGVSVVNELLAAAPGLAVLATSRGPLRLAGERLFAVSPLSVPGDGAALAADLLARYDAVRLFVERAQAVKPDFQLTAANAPAVVEICRRLDGLPLAIELAAARVRLVSPQTLLARLDEHGSPLQVLGGGPRDLPRRQQTLRDTIAWSYDLLSPQEQLLFDRMGVFAGGATLEAIEAVANADGDLGLDVFEGVDALTTSSLVRGETLEEASRFGMLVTVRAFARERLVAEDAWEGLRRRHAEHYAALAERLSPRLHSPARQSALAELDAEQDNLRAALGWAVGTPSAAELAVRLAAALRWFWYWHSQFSEGVGWMQAALACAVPWVPSVTWATARYGLGALVWMQGNLSWARIALEEGIALLRQSGNQRELAEALTVLARVTMQQGDAQAAQGHAAEALALTRITGDRWWEGITLSSLGDSRLLAGDLDQAEAAFAQGLALFEGMGDPFGLGMHRVALAALAARRGDYAAARELSERAVADQRAARQTLQLAYSLASLGEAALHTGDFDGANASYQEGLRHYRDFGNHSGVAACLIGLADVALARGQHGRAVRLLAAAPGHAKVVSRVLVAMPDGEFADKLAAARGSMDEAAFRAARTAGQAMTTEQAFAYALGKDDG